jgi:hypothetical protein
MARLSPKVHGLMCTRFCGLYTCTLVIYRVSRQSSTVPLRGETGASYWVLRIGSPGCVISKVGSWQETQARNGKAIAQLVANGTLQLIGREKSSSGLATSPNSDD